MARDTEVEALEDQSLFCRPKMYDIHLVDGASATELKLDHKESIPGMPSTQLRRLGSVGNGVS